VGIKKRQIWTGDVDMNIYTYILYLLCENKESYIVKKVSMYFSPLQYCTYAPKRSTAISVFSVICSTYLKEMAWVGMNDKNTFKKGYYPHKDRQASVKVTQYSFQIRPLGEYGIVP